MNTEPREIISTLYIYPYTNSEIIIRVKSTDPEDAKMVTDVIATEAARYYCELQAEPLQTNIDLLNSKLKQMKTSLAAKIKQNKSGLENVLKDTEIKAAQDSYRNLSVRLANAEINLEQFNNNGVIRKIGPAYVYPAPSVILTFFKERGIGVMILIGLTGILLGFLTGLIVGARRAKIQLAH